MLNRLLHVIFKEGAGNDFAFSSRTGVTFNKTRSMHVKVVQVKPANGM
jgi:hypothetical protein